VIVATHAIDCRRADHIVVSVGGPLGRSVHTGNVGVCRRSGGFGRWAGNFGKYLQK